MNGLLDHKTHTHILRQNFLNFHYHRVRLFLQFIMILSCSSLGIKVCLMMNINSLLCSPLSAAIRPVLANNLHLKNIFI